MVWCTLFQILFSMKKILLDVNYTIFVFYNKDEHLTVIGFNPFNNGMVLIH